MGIDREPVVEALDGLMAFIDDLDHQLGRLIEAHPLPPGAPGQAPDAAVPVAPVLARIRGQRQRLAQVEALAERHVAHALGTGKKQSAGLQLEVHGGWERKEWQHRDVFRLLAELTLVDEETGELNTEYLATVMRVGDAVLAACRPDWRVTVLRARGLSLDGLCKETPKRMTVQVLTPAETR